MYIKSKEMICDFLSVIGVDKSLERFEELLAFRDESNQHNRVTNCYMANLGKAMKASHQQAIAIRALKEKEEFLELPIELQQLADARLNNMMFSMQELANHLQISKSCLSHRMRRLLSVAEKYVEKDERE